MEERTASFNNSPVISSTDGVVVGATLSLPDKTTNFRTEVTTTQNAYYMEWVYPGVTLTPDEWRRLILFMDAHGAYISHDHKSDEQCYGSVVEPAFE